MSRANKINWKEYLFNKWVYIVLIVLVVSFSFMSPVFATKGNMANLLRSMPTLGIVTLGLTMLIITGGVDLSCGAIVAASGTAAAALAVKGMNPIICILAGIVVGAICGYFNGYMITRFKLQPFIVTLGSNYFIRGIILVATKGIFISGLPDWFYKISNTNIFGNIIYSNTVVFVVLAFMVGFLMKHTTFGRYCYAVGSNKEASRLSGINVTRHFRTVYLIHGALAGITGVIMMSYLNVGASSEAVGLEAYAIAASIIGGTQFGGGIGTIGGAVSGLLTIEVLKNGLAVVGINTYGQQAVTGLLILVAIVIDFLRKESLFKITTEKTKNKNVN